MAMLQRIPADQLELSAAGDAGGGGTGREYVDNLWRDETEPWCKWYHPEARATSWVQADFPAPWPFWGLGRYRLQAANDCPHRDPMAWVLRGQLATTDEWQVLHVVNGYEFQSRWEVANFDLDPEWLGVPLRAVRLEFVRVRAPRDGIQLGHWHLFGVPLPRDNPALRPPPTLATAQAGTAEAGALRRLRSGDLWLSAAGDVRGGGTGREFVTNLALDGTERWCKWYHYGSMTTSWLQADFAAPRPVWRIGRYSVQSADDCPRRDPRAWVLRGRHAATNEWLTLHTVEHYDFTERWQTVVFDLPAEHAEAPLTAVRLEILAVRERCDGIQLGHWRLFGTPAPDAVPAAIGADAADPQAVRRILPGQMHLSAAGDVCGGGTGREFVANLAIDGTENWCKWYHWSAERSWVQADFVAAAPVWCVHLYSVQAADDCPHRDPAGWVLRGRDAVSGQWRTLHTVESFEFQGRWQVATFELPGDVTAIPLTAVRLEIPAPQQRIDGIQLGHWYLFGHPAAVH